MNVGFFCFVGIFEMDSPLNGCEIYRQRVGHGDRCFRPRKDHERTLRWEK